MYRYVHAQQRGLKEAWLRNLSLAELAAAPSMATMPPEPSALCALVRRCTGDCTNAAIATPACTDAPEYTGAANYQQQLPACLPTCLQLYAASYPYQSL
jgi:hypothetical protein